MAGLALAHVLVTRGGKTRSTRKPMRLQRLPPPGEYKHCIPLQGANLASKAGEKYPPKA